MTLTEQQRILNKYSPAIGRLVTRMIPTIKHTFQGIELINLLMALPVKFELKEINLAEMTKKDGSVATMEDCALSGFIERDSEKGNQNRLVVFFVFMKDINIDWDTYFNVLLNKQSYSDEMAFIYLHEAMHLLLRHYDFYLNQTYLQLVKSIRNDMTEAQMFELLNSAFDYWINGYLIGEARQGSVMSNWKNIGTGFNGLYDPNLIPILLTQQEIVRKLAEEAKITRQDLKDADGNQFGNITTIEINGLSSTTINIDRPPASCASQNCEAPNTQEQEIGEVMDSTRNNILSKTKGSASQEMFEKLGISYAVPIDWFKYLKSSLFNIAQRYTNNYDQTWSKMKNKFRHVAPLPGRVYYEKQLALVISIDQSGSMSNSDLEKINYVVAELGRHTLFTEVLLHDTEVAERRRFHGKKFLGIRDFITTRVACGGTSHKEVFQILKEIKEENPKYKLLYLSFSDNYSDIEQVFDPEIFKNIIPYWITTDEKNTVSVPGMQISLEHGVLQT